MGFIAFILVQLLNSCASSVSSASAVEYSRNYDAFMEEVIKFTSNNGK